MTRNVFALVCLACLAAVTGSRAFAVPYSVVDLQPATGYSQSMAFDISGNGYVVGYVTKSDGNPRTFRWQSGVMQDLGTFGYTDSLANAVNDAGQIAGIYDVLVGSTMYSYGYRWDGGSLTPVGVLAPGEYAFSVARDMNSAGVVVGDSRASDGRVHGFVWEDGVMEQLGTLSGSGTSVAFGVNDAGQVVGTASYSPSSEHAFLWEDGIMHDLGVFGGTHSVAQDINASGQVVGYCYSPYTGGPKYACLWDSGTISQLDSLGGSESVAFGIDGPGVVVGWSKRPDGSIRPVVWNDGQVQELPGLGGSTGMAFGINDAGWIVGYSTIASGQTHACLWIPVPEPSSLVFLGFAVLGLAGVFRRHRA